LNINNIETIFEKNSIPIEFDLLSIDVDFNDYYLWEAINLYKPRVVIIEYNSSLGQHNTLVVPYKRDKVWDGTGYFGSSLKALENLGIKKGYSLVGCNSIGSNAFFVRSDIVKDLFCSPYTSENHFEPRFLVNLRNGHPKKIAEYINLDNKY
ncbi:MAG: hypothetical protein LBF97_02590, partial [Elusimicrobiota bacterium]|nr:hypothetical protein [Elusimicrobiota bacterium]